MIITLLNTRLLHHEAMNFPGNLFYVEFPYKMNNTHLEYCSLFNNTMKRENFKPYFIGWNPRSNVICIINNRIWLLRWHIPIAVIYQDVLPCWTLNGLTKTTTLLASVGLTYTSPPCKYHVWLYNPHDKLRYLALSSRRNICTNSNNSLAQKTCLL